MENKLYSDLAKSLLKAPFDPAQLKNSNILVTGATGTIGKMLAKALLYMNGQFGTNITVLAFVRDIDKAKSLFSDDERKSMDFIIGDICSQTVTDKDIDHILHCASSTSSRSFVENPVEVVKTSIIGSINMLELAKNKGVKSMAYISSMEVYGSSVEDELLTEKDIRYLDPLALRSSYPESKRMVENLCAGYFAEYNVPVKIVRLVQTFGRGISKNDQRVFAQFIRSVAAGEDIKLMTDGASKHMYLDTAEAVTAVLTVLLMGRSGEAYNAANPDTYCSIKEMAQLVIDKFADKPLKVMCNMGNAKQYPPAHKLCLDTAKINALGWRAETPLEEMYKGVYEELFGR